MLPIHIKSHILPTFSSSTRPQSILMPQTLHNPASLPGHNTTNPTATGFDLTGYYPTSLKPLWMSQIRTWYHTTYGDRFFAPNPP
jgi:hypothetical protein